MLGLALPPNRRGPHRRGCAPTDGLGQARPLVLTTGRQLDEDGFDRRDLRQEPLRSQRRPIAHLAATVITGLEVKENAVKAPRSAVVPQFEISGRRFL
jgi:hypothetical protein